MKAMYLSDAEVELLRNLLNNELDVISHTFVRDEEELEENRKYEYSLRNLLTKVS